MKFRIKLHEMIFKDIGLESVGVRNKHGQTNWDRLFKSWLACVSVRLSEHNFTQILSGSIEVLVSEVLSIEINKRAIIHLV